MIIANPDTLEERISAASACARNLKLAMPAVVDSIDNAAESAYSGWPDRLYLIDMDGRIAFKSDPGPYGFKPDELRRNLARVLGEPNPK